MKENKKPTHWLWKYVAAILLFAATVNGAMYLPIPTLSTLTSSDWLGFWGGYLGGAIGCIPAIAALLHSQSESKRLHEETAEAQRRSVLPIFSIDIQPPSSYSSYSTYITLFTNGTSFVKPILPNTDIYNELAPYDEETSDHIGYGCTLQNIGLGPALNLVLLFKSSQNDRYLPAKFNSYGKEQQEHLLLFLPKESTSTIELVFSDILGNEYSQHFKISHIKANNTFTVCPVSAPSLVKPE